MCSCIASLVSKYNNYIDLQEKIMFSCSKYNDILLYFDRLNSGTCTVLSIRLITKINESYQEKLILKDVFTIKLEQTHHKQGACHDLFRYYHIL